MKHFNIQILLYAVGFIAELAIAIIASWFYIKRKLAESLMLCIGAVFIFINSMINAFMLIRTYVLVYPNISSTTGKIITIFSATLWVIGWLCFVSGLFLLIKKYLLANNAMQIEKKKK